jgi:hypothetical protein
VSWYSIEERPLQLSCHPMYCRNSRAEVSDRTTTYLLSMSLILVAKEAVHIYFRTIQGSGCGWRPLRDAQGLAHPTQI